MRSSLLTLMLAFATSLTAPGRAEPQAGPPRAPRDTNLTHALYLADGSTLVGKLIARDSATIRFETNGGLLTIPVSRVKELREIRPADVRGNEYWFPDANETRLFFAPTGRMLKKGDGYYSNTYLLLQNFVGAPSDRFTFGGGFSIIPSDDFISNNVYYLTPKFGLYNAPEANVAAGALVGAVPASGFEDAATFGLLYAVGTRGGPDASMTAGVGYGFANGHLSERPILMVGGATRTSRRVSLVTENYVWWTREQQYLGCGPSSCNSRSAVQGHAVISYGLRFLGEKVSTDFALWNYGEEMIFPGIPYIAFAVRF